MLNKVQKAAFDLIQSDARFIYTLVDMQNNAKNINSIRNTGCFRKGLQALRPL